MDTTKAPERVSRYEVDQMAARFGEDAPIVRGQRERLKAWEDHLAENRRRNDAAKADRDAELATRAQARQDERERERQREADALEAGIRRRFFAANGAASEADWQRLKPRLIDDELLDRTRAAADADVEGLRASGNYRM